MLHLDMNFKMEITSILMFAVLIWHVNSERKCVENAADIVFVLDTSRSIWSVDFDTYLIPFVKNVTDMFDVGPFANQTRFGITTFSNDYQLQFHLNKFFSKESLLRGIDSMRYDRGNTFTDKAIDFAFETMFTKQNGARDNVQHIIIVLTDGGSNKPSLTRAAALKAKNSGITIFTIGVGRQIIQQELVDMASKPETDFVFHVATFSSLDSIRQTFARVTCSVLKSTTTRLPTTVTMRTTSEAYERQSTTESPTTTLNEIQNDEREISYCGGKRADLYFVLDSSNSVWIEDFNVRMLGFVRHIVGSFDISPSLTRVGMVTYSNITKPVFDLKSYTTKEGLLRAIEPDVVQYMGGHTYTADAIRYVRERGFGRGSSAREDAAHVLVVITDGISQNPMATKREAAAAKKEGVIVFAIGVGKYVNHPELRDIASDPDDQYVFLVENFSALSSIQNVLAQRTCNIISDEVKKCTIPPSNVHFIYKSGDKSSSERAAIMSAVRAFTGDTEMQKSPIRVSITTDPCQRDISIDFSSIESFRRELASKSLGEKDMMMYSMVKKIRHQFSRRDNRENTMVVFVDENTEDIRNLMSETMRAKYLGFKIFVVVVGDVSPEYVSYMASRPTESYVKKVDSYHDLNQLSEFKILSCRTVEA